MTTQQCDERPVEGTRTDSAAPPGMLWIPGGTFLMGSDRHYPEEAPAHRVTVDGFWMDRTPVTNEAFQAFVTETGHVTFAEVAPAAADYPGAKRGGSRPGADRWPTTGRASFPGKT